MSRLRVIAAAAAIGVAGVLSIGSADAAKRTIKPKAGTYIGQVTSGNGAGEVRAIFATFTGRNNRQTKGVSLFQWTGTLACDDGTKRDTSLGVFAALKGVKFSGESGSGIETVTLRGKFTANTKLTATVRVRSAGGTPATTCDTGPVKFKASRRR